MALRKPGENYLNSSAGFWGVLHLGGVSRGRAVADFSIHRPNRLSQSMWAYYRAGEVSPPPVCCRCLGLPDGVIKRPRCTLGYFPSSICRQCKHAGAVDRNSLRIGLHRNQHRSRLPLRTLLVGRPLGPAHDNCGDNRVIGGNSAIFQHCVVSFVPAHRGVAGRFGG